MPLSSNGLCDAEITTPASNPSCRVRYATAGVGDDAGARHRRALPPARRAPARARSTRPTRACRVPRARSSRPEDPARTRAPAPRRAAGRSRASSGGSPALPRTPSVPKSRSVMGIRIPARSSLDRHSDPGRLRPHQLDALGQHRPGWAACTGPASRPARSTKVVTAFASSAVILSPGPRNTHRRHRRASPARAASAARCEARRARPVSSARGGPRQS